MTATTIIDDKGMAEIRVGNKTTVLHGTLENLKLFEKRNDGIFKLVHRFHTNDVHASDLAEVIWCFSYDRDTEGWTGDQIMRTIFHAGADQIRELIGHFLQVLFTPPDDYVADTAKKKTVTKKSA